MTVDLSFFHTLPVAIQTALLEGPALKPPNGTKSNFDHPPNRDTMGFAVQVVASAIIGLLVIAMLYARARYHKKVYIEDFVAVAALGVYASFIYFTWRVVASPGIFVHQWNIRLKQIPDLLYKISVGSTIYGVVIMLLKCGILLHWSRIFVPKSFPRNGFWWTCYITMAVNVLFYVICTFIEIFGCTPREKLWNIMLEGKCLDMPKIMIASAFINFFSDLIIFILPHRVIWNLRMSREKKFGIGALFTIGIFATVCAGCRIKSTYDYSNNPDVTYMISSVGLWCIAEMTAGFLVLCLPTMPKLFSDSPWIGKLVSIIKSVTKSSSGVSKSISAKASNSWPRNKPKRGPYDSLFTDTGVQSEIPLAKISGFSQARLSEVKGKKSEHVQVITAEHGYRN